MQSYVNLINQWMIVGGFRFLIQIFSVFKGEKNQIVIDNIEKETLFIVHWDPHFIWNTNWEWNRRLVCLLQARHHVLRYLFATMPLSPQSSLGWDTKKTYRWRLVVFAKWLFITGHIHSNTYFVNRHVSHDSYFVCDKRALKIPNLTHPEAIDFCTVLSVKCKGDGLEECLLIILLQ